MGVMATQRMAACAFVQQLVPVINTENNQAAVINVAKAFRCHGVMILTDEYTMLELIEAEWRKYRSVI